jgi:hypothetical protein
VLVSNPIFDRKGTLVPYLKCVSCRIRVSAAAAGADPTAASCPGCDQPLEPAASLIEVLGFRTPRIHDHSALPRRPDRVSDISGGREAAQAQHDAERWLDDGGRPLASALAESIALPRPRAGP